MPSLVGNGTERPGQAARGLKVPTGKQEPPCVCCDGHQDIEAFAKEGASRVQLFGDRDKVGNGMDTEGMNGQPFQCDHTQREVLAKEDGNNYSVQDASEVQIKGDASNFESSCPTIPKLLAGEMEAQWRFRGPPRGVADPEEYALCEGFLQAGHCRLGAQCVLAHSPEELLEWKQRHPGCLQLNDIDKGYAETLLEKWLNAVDQSSVMVSALDGIRVHHSPELNLSVSDKNCTNLWTFTLKCQPTYRLSHIALLHDSDRPYFSIDSIFCCSSKGPEDPADEESIELKDYALLHGNAHPPAIGKGTQEWHQQAGQCNTQGHAGSSEAVYTVRLRFSADVHGSFQQTIVFDFGFDPVLALSVSVCTTSTYAESTKEELLLSGLRWDCGDPTFVIMPYQVPENTDELWNKEKADEDHLKKLYQVPDDLRSQLDGLAVAGPLSQNSYRKRFHVLLFMEEIAQYREVGRFNLRTQIQVLHSFMLTGTNGGAKYAQNGTLFGRFQLAHSLSEDTPPGRLLATSVDAVLVLPSHVVTPPGELRFVYQALIEDKTKQHVFLRFSKQCCIELGLRADQKLQVELQFQLNRKPLCEMHAALDRLPDLSVLFPSIGDWPNTLLAPLRQWDEFLDPCLNSKQKEAVLAITTPLSQQLPPVLLVGPFGTGKTFTLAQVAKHVLLQPDSRVLICTHSNSAADLYIKDYFHPYVESGHEEARPLRIYYRHRWVKSVHPTVQLYCLLTPGRDAFLLPTSGDVRGHRVIVATLSTSRCLCQLDLPTGFFSHIFIDEAAQALETEAITPLVLATADTRIVLAGDHMQLSPTVHSEFARKKGLHISLLERLYDLYPLDFPCRILLCENYRSHADIVSFTSEMFYDGHILSRGRQPPHGELQPLCFFAAHGQEEQDKNSITFYNDAEVSEVVERVEEIYRKWPAAWGENGECSIGVVTPYADQVFRMRVALRKKRLHDVSVERVLNVQGKQFRVVLLSTVRTWRSYHTRAQRKGDSEMESELELGFLSDPKLLNTAVTRAQSLLAVVGDPIALCSSGRCRKVWEHFLAACELRGSLYGTSLERVRSELRGLELKTYVLNPLAPEFVPRALRQQQPATPAHLLHPFAWSHRYPQIRPRCALTGSASQTKNCAQKTNQQATVEGHEDFIRSGDTLTPILGRKVPEPGIYPPQGLVPGSPLLHGDRQAPYAPANYPCNVLIPLPCPQVGWHGPVGLDSQQAATRESPILPRYRASGQQLEEPEDLGVAGEGTNSLPSYAEAEMPYLSSLLSTYGKLEDEVADERTSQPLVTAQPALAQNSVVQKSGQQMPLPRAITGMPTSFVGPASGLHMSDTGLYQAQPTTWPQLLTTHSKEPPIGREPWEAETHRQQASANPWPRSYQGTICPQPDKPGLVALPPSHNELAHRFIAFRNRPTHHSMVPGDQKSFVLRPHLLPFVQTHHDDIGASASTPAGSTSHDASLVFQPIIPDMPSFDDRTFSAFPAGFPTLVQPQCRRATMHCNLPTQPLVPDGQAKPSMLSPVGQAPLRGPPPISRESPVSSETGTAAPYRLFTSVPFRPSASHDGGTWGAGVRPNDGTQQIPLEHAGRPIHNTDMGCYPVGNTYRFSGQHLGSSTQTFHFHNPVAANVYPSTSAQYQTPAQYSPAKPLKYPFVNQASSVIGGASPTTGQEHAENVFSSADLDSWPMLARKSISGRVPSHNLNQPLHHDVNTRHQFPVPAHPPQTQGWQQSLGIPQLWGHLKADENGPGRPLYKRGLAQQPTQPYRPFDPCPEPLSSAVVNQSRDVCRVRTTSQAQRTREQPVPHSAPIPPHPPPPPPPLPFTAHGIPMDGMVRTYASAVRTPRRVDPGLNAVPFVPGANKSATPSSKNGFYTYFK
uniref:probable helicase with zinc finger domain isoform X2 n=1 Tax=Myxine glutinosa TaxID=7769 RepID=UPI00358DDE83